MAIRNHVVVGTDGSDAATRAVTVAAREAELRGVRLRVVHAFVWPALVPPLGAPAPGVSDPALREAGQQILREARSAAEQAAPGVECETELVADLPAAALLRETDDAELVVVGDRGLGGFASLLLGSTAIQLSTYASCPILVVRGERIDFTGRIVVGVDASEHAQRALGFAFEEAAFRGVGVHALHAWTEPVSTGPGDMIPLVYDPQVVDEEETRLTAELLAGWSEKYPDVRLTRDVVREAARHALIEASQDAGLVVVGARGVGGFRGMLFGSVSQALLHHSHCPVAIVRAPE